MKAKTYDKLILNIETLNELIKFSDINLRV